MAVSALEIAMGLNMIADIYFKLRQQGAEITPDNIRDHIAGLEARAAANDALLGIDK